MLDTYGLFALCPSLEHLDVLIAELQRANALWADEPSYGRSLNVGNRARGPAQC
jgi:hypothetical protein